MKRKKPKLKRKCVYCGAVFETDRESARFCKTSHRVNAHRKAQIERLKDLEAKHGVR